MTFGWLSRLHGFDLAGKNVNELGDALSGRGLMNEALIRKDDGVDFLDFGAQSLEIRREILRQKAQWHPGAFTGFSRFDRYPESL